MIVGILYLELWIWKQSQLQMCVEIVKYGLVEYALRVLKNVQVSTKGDEVRFELCHRILSQASRAEANALTEWANPLLVI